MYRDGFFFTKMAVVLISLFFTCQTSVFAVDVGETAPDFTAPVYYEGGPPASTITLSDYQGWIFIINMWADW